RLRAHHHLPSFPTRRSSDLHGSAEQIWGIVLLRYNVRNNESDYWPRVSSRISGTLNQEGAVAGFEGVSPSHNMQFNPYTTARALDRKSTRLNSSHGSISYAV